MLSYRLGTVNDFHWKQCANQFSAIQYSKPHNYSTFFGEENDNQIFIYILYQGHLKHRQNDRKVKKESILKSREVLLMSYRKIMTILLFLYLGHTIDLSLVVFIENLFHSESSGY